MISILFAALFGWSLLPGRRPLCLRFAERISDGILPDGAIPYCRRLTWVWLFVLLANAALSMSVLAVLPNGAWRFLVPLLLSAIVVAGTFAVEKPIRDRRFSVTFHTSGSTSNPKSIVKTFESLAKEVAFHRARLADILEQKPTFLSTVEPQHMYGTLWRTMLPRAAECPADPEVILTPESLIAKMSAARKVFLVTTPSFLERFAAYADLYEVPQNCIAITTSGALLTPAVSAAAARIFGVVPTEIFGSTETGGVASRQQNTPDCDWTVFDPVKVQTTPDGRLEVRSPFSFKKRFAMGDAVTLSADRRTFKLHGRLDRLVKIAEQRVLLPELEDAVRALPEIADAALCPLEGPHGTYLGLVVVTRRVEDNAPYHTELHDSGRARCPQRATVYHNRALALRQKLLPIFPKGTVPKKYRFVHELPRNAQGKVLASAIREILLSNLVEPIVENVVRTENSWSADFTFDPDAPYFKGHFPGFPLLPGVVQIGFAHHFAEVFLHRSFTVGSVKKMKFSRPIVPGERIRFTLEKRSDTELAYVYAKGEAVCSSGCLVLSA